MRVILKTTMAGPSGVHHAGETVDLPEGEAKWLVRTGSAQAIAAATPVVSIETETVAQPEMAVAPRQRGRPRGS